jgi:hypothetical protein
MRQGGVKWRSGSDTCVFKPAVRCEGETERPGGDVVSRVMTKGSLDEGVEARIAKEFPQLVENGTVTVHTKSCTPQLDAEDLQSDPALNKALRGCKFMPRNPGAYPNLANLLTPNRGDETVYSVVTRGNMRELTAMLRPLLDAAATMVPDGGPWIIHADCHLRNLLWDGTTPSMIDWGRTVVIEDPTNLRSLREGLTAWVNESFRWIVTAYDRTLRAQGRTESPLQRWEGIFLALAKDGDIAGGTALGQYAQHPAYVFEALSAVFSTPPETVLVQGVLRGWLSFVLVNQLLNPEFREDPGNEAHAGWADLLRARSQADLRGQIEAILASVAPAPAPSAPPLSPLGSLTVSPSPVGGLYWPAKYSRGLTPSQNAQRKRSATRRAKLSSRNPKAYGPWKTDTGAKTRRSSYSSTFHSKYPGVTTLPEIAKATGISKATLQTVYDRGLAAWRTGHRPGASQHAWGMARVHSFVLKGKTYRTADADLAKTSRGKE